MKPSISILLIGLAFTLGACNTVQGIGQDVQKAGNAIERAAR
ncbi:MULTISPECIES: entericidin A/B family lipoprotein [Comamonas]|jgi:predicted small secreted protein|uniref:Entericidin, EcnA/B family n=2 Tax=Comamonas TaxID=283 RepID=A0A2A7UZ85_COMTR|nr:MULTISPECIES: entericidin A/B family lipoprotein [Comamonas]MDR2325829.1 entericidin A/B family lipoprotein [Acidovorax sp.]MBD9531922.1 entericidin A/B family lipoprotein [Comamonas sp. CMM01]MBV7419786.1 entericidin A/B family lipoprotein [Comamonas sp. CMM03]MDE1555100.1 entericidin A/B family lipoprotein [Comamonas aquatica]MDH0047631.1 entericidin A/B family lipoprotein [Comamonas terrigena]